MQIFAYRLRSRAMNPRRLQQRATSSISVAPTTVTDRTAPLVLGLEPRVFRELVASRNIPHARVGHRIVARIEDVLGSLDALSAEQRSARAFGKPAAADLEAGVNAILAKIGRRLKTPAELAAEKGEKVGTLRKR